MASRRPTILQIVPELDTGGAELSTIEIAEAIVNAGGRALIATEGGGMAAKIRAVGGELLFFPAATKMPWRIWLNARSLRRIIVEEKVDLVHARSRAPAWSAKLATQSGTAKTPFVTTYHGAYSEKNRLKKWYNEVMASGDLVIANSNFTSKLITDRYGTPESKLRVVYRGLDPERYDRNKIDPERTNKLLKRWAVSPDSRIILNVARLTHWKGQTVIIDAAKRLLDEDKLHNVIFVLAGSHQSHARYQVMLREKINNLGLADYFRFAGHVDDIPAALTAAYLSVVASTEPEAFGRAAAEAQAMACPIISTNIGAPPETVRAISNSNAADVTGWLIPPSDDVALAQAINEALTSPEAAYNAMGERGRIHATTNFSLDNMKRKTLSVYDELLGTTLTENLAQSEHDTT